MKGKNKKNRGAGSGVEIPADNATSSAQAANQDNGGNTDIGADNPATDTTRADASGISGKERVGPNASNGQTVTQGGDDSLTAEQERGAEHANGISGDDGGAVKDGELLQKLEESERQCREYLDRWQRSVAEFDNYRRRTQAEIDRVYTSGAAETINALLPVVDSIERAVSALTPEPSVTPASSDAEASSGGDSAIREGLLLIEKQVHETFKKLKIETLPGVGEQFDPNLHDAMMHSEDEAYGTNTITEVFLKGYKYKDRVVRHGMVKVAN